MALDATGLTIRRFPEIQSAMQIAIQQNINTGLSFDEDLILGQLVTILSSELANLEATTQAVYDAFDKDKAEGSSLDALAGLLGVPRLGASFTEGTTTFIGDDGASIPVGTILANPSTNDQFETTEDLSLSNTACIKSVWSVGTVSNSTQYDMVVEGNTYSFTSDIDATDVEILAGLEAAINFPPTKTWTASVNTTFLEVVSDDDTVNISVSSPALMTPEVTTITGNVIAQEEGNLRVPVSSLTVIVTSVGGLTSTINTADLTTGRIRETDAELRLRMTESLQLSGSATEPAMNSSLSNVVGVSSVVIVENVSNVDDIYGRPPGSFEIIITGGDDTDIANTIWEDKPLGVSTFGTTAVVIQDSAGFDKTVNFSRPVSQSIEVNIEYTKYSEEDFPANGEDLIKDSIVSTGLLLAAGEDVIPKRFLGGVYSSVSGVEELTIEMRIPYVVVTPSNVANGTVHGFTITVNDGDDLIVSIVAGASDDAEDVATAMKAAIDGDVDVSDHVTTIVVGTGTEGTLEIYPTTVTDIFDITLNSGNTLPSNTSVAYSEGRIAISPTTVASFDIADITVTEV